MEVEIRRRIETISGVKLSLCYQCGTCSSGCPVVEMMALSPSRVINGLLKNDESVLNGNTIWLCAACYTCDVRCPRGLRISAVMEAARALFLRRGKERMELKDITPEDYEDIPPITLIATFRKYTG